MQRKLLFVILMSIATLISAQEIKVVRFGIVPGDNTAELSPRKDLGDNLCALVKVKTNNISGLKFTNHNQYVGDVSYHDDGVYYVYIPTITSKLSFVHENYQPGEIDMAVFGYKKSIKSGKTYEAILEAPSLLQSTTGVTFKVTPIVEGSYIVIDNRKLTIPKDGIVKYGCSQGSHLYKVEADNYKTESGSVSVTNTFEPVVITLRPVTVEVNIESTPSNAQIYIDNVSYGKTGLKQLPLGEHDIRLSAKGYIDHIQHINITNEMVNLPHITLRKNNGKYEIVHPVEVTVICYTTNLYKNNKRIEEWNTNNQTIKIMPGTKCRLSDDYGMGAVLEVKAGQRRPMKIRLAGGRITVLNNDNSNAYVPGAVLSDVKQMRGLNDNHTGSVNSAISTNFIGGSTDSSSGSVIGDLVLVGSGDMLNDKNILVGTWNYKKACVLFENEYLFAKAGGFAVSNNVEAKLETYYHNVDIMPGVCKFVFGSDNSLKYTIGNKTMQGTYTFDSSKKTVIITTALGTNVTAYVSISGTAMGLTFDASKLLTLITSASSVSSSTLNSISSIASNYSGMKVGFELSK